MPSTITQVTGPTKANSGESVIGGFRSGKEAGMRCTSRRAFGGRWKTALLAVITVFAGLLITAAPASAATPQCTSWVVSYDEGYVPSTSSGETNCWMLRGNYSDGVWALQMALVHCYGQYVGPNGPDSDFGGNTFNALKRVQELHGIKNDGGYGPQTRSVLRFYWHCS